MESGASSRYPAYRQGLTMGIVRAGTIGTMISALIGQFLAAWLGWRAMFGVMLLPAVLALLLILGYATEGPIRTENERPRSTVTGWRQPECWRLCLLYAMTFGGFASLSSMLNSFMVDHFSVPGAAAGMLTAPVILIGSLLRPLGGRLADQRGGVPILLGAFTLLTGATTLLILGFRSLPLSMPAFAGMMVSFAAGNGAVFQIAPLRFRKPMGIVTGLVGAAGGPGGYFLSATTGGLVGLTGSYRGGFGVFGALAIVGWLLVRQTAACWEGLRKPVVDPHVFRAPNPTSIDRPAIVLATLAAEATTASPQQHSA